MDFSSLILPLTKNICRTCLMESESTMFMNIQDLVEHDSNKIKLIDILVYLNCLENNDEENWPQAVCSSCVSTALVAYNFKLNCWKANSTLSRILMVQSPTNFQRTDIDAIDINVVYQDHEYDVPLFSNHPTLDFDTHLPVKKELTPLPPVTVITSTEQPPRKEGEKKYSCSLCDKSFTRLYGLRYHMAKHNDVKRFLCPECGKGFFTSGGLRQHLISHKDIAQFKCGFCNKTYKSRQSLKEHFRVAHSSNRSSFMCVTCCKTFTAKSTLMMHIKGHNGKKYLCSLCPKTYTRASYLRAHTLVHSGTERPRPFSCSYKNCDRSFTSKHSLSVHIAYTHTAERPHKCERCFKGFATASGLKTHLETHTGKEGVSCGLCGKLLANKRGLQKHVKSHDVDADDMILETVVDNVFLDQAY